MHREVASGIEAIYRAVGESPVGFRAPGYTVSDDLFGVLEDLGVLYDASVFPCPLYYGAKTSKIGMIRLRGRESRSIVDDPRVLSAPTVPYRVGTPYWRRGAGLLELPVQVTRGARLPFIGSLPTPPPPPRTASLFDVPSPTPAPAPVATAPVEAEPGEEDEEEILTEIKEDETDEDETIDEAA